MKTVVALLGALSLAAVLGCATLAEGDRINELHAKLDPGVGKATKEEIAHAWGPPDSRDVIGRSEYWTYRMDYGHRHRLIDTGDGVVVGRSVHKEDRIVMEFVRGILVTWRADVRR